MENTTKSWVNAQGIFVTRHSDGRVRMLALEDAMKPLPRSSKKVAINSTLSYWEAMQKEKDLIISSLKKAMTSASANKY